MENEPHPLPQIAASPNPAPVGDTASGAGKPGLIAPWWHLLLIIALVLFNSFAGAFGKKNVIAPGGSKLFLYGGTFFFELILILLIWFAIRHRGVTMRELIGGRWDSFESFLLDVAIAAIFFVAAQAILVGLRMALGVLDLHNTSQQIAQIKKTLGPLIPKTGIEVTAFIVLSVFAGLFEEIIFRGYLQRQFAAMGKNAWAGIIGSAVIFGLGHGYQGNRMMIVIAVYGALFGILVHMRKSLRPGMMAHAFQDAFSGIALFFFSKSGMM
ncbi:MAG TPA: type II CAAX endopeptidase family protein [Candidatus Angelobacter sp.]|jgi:membrane protease YdiL (CAAX protease family)|nr:type II CAAX endopeptidase family protein [Candidatus Angelobacter sp.]